MLVAHLKRLFSLECSVLQDLVLAKNTEIQRHYPYSTNYMSQKRSYMPNKRFILELVQLFIKYLVPKSPAQVTMV